MDESYALFSQFTVSYHILCEKCQFSSPELEHQAVFIQANADTQVSK